MVKPLKRYVALKVTCKKIGLPMENCSVHVVPTVSYIHRHESSPPSFLSITVGYGKFGFEKFGVFSKNYISDSEISESKKSSVEKFGVKFQKRPVL